MTFQPVLPASGLLGWRYLDRTMERQLETFGKSPANKRDTDYFMENIGAIKSAEELVGDRRLLRVALGAYGLQDDLQSKAFIQKVLEGGTENNRSLANRLADERYKSFADKFGFGNAAGAQTGAPGFGADIVSRFRAAQFEVAIGKSDDTMRLALNAKRELSELAGKSVSEKTKWFLILGNPPLRSVFEKALSLPKSFGQVDIEKQLETMQDLSSRRLDIDSLSDLSDAKKLDKFVERFLLQAQIAEFSQTYSPLNTALTLLQN